MTRTVSGSANAMGSEEHALDITHANQTSLFSVRELHRNSNGTESDSHHVRLSSKKQNSKRNFPYQIGDSRGHMLWRKHQHCLYPVSKAQVRGEFCFNCCTIDFLSKCATTQAAIALKKIQRTVQWRQYILRWV